MHAACARQPLIQPPLALHISNRNACIRMAVIACFVSMYEVMGEALFNHLGTLNLLQIKLIRIYIDKHMKTLASGNQ